MTVTVTEALDLARLVHEARDEDAAVAELEGCLRRLRRARAAQTTLATLPPEQLRAALRIRRLELGSDPT